MQYGIESDASWVILYLDNPAAFERKRPEGFPAAKKQQKNKCNSTVGPSSIPTRQPTWQFHSYSSGLKVWKDTGVKQCVDSSSSSS